ncbi:MAG: valine--tRNA ligase [Candidatus Woesearchaeota archaeon]
MDLPQKYDPKEAELKWQKFWEENKVYTFDAKDQDKEVYSIDTPPPTVSGRMHIGHAFSYSQEDFIARFQRMKGKNVFYPFGTDDNGLPSERLVEKTKKVKSTRMDRQEFISLCNETIQELKPEFVQDWKNLGMSCDWQTSYSTIDSHSIKTAQKSFLDLWKKGLVERRNEVTMWDITDQTAIAQAELEDMEKESTFNDISFEIEGDSDIGNDDNNDNDKRLVIATTRPELIPACVMIFVHPEDERYKNLIGKKVKVPTTTRTVEIIADKSANPEKGSGAMMVCSYGDRFDADAIKRHKKMPIVILNKDGKLNEKAGKYAGLKILDARTQILNDLKIDGKLIEQKKIKHVVNVAERSKTPIEFIETPQYFVKILEHKKQFLEMGEKINWYPQHMHKRYVQWVEGLEWDWCISRQRHFGVPFPVWYEKDTGKIIVADESQLPVEPLTDKPKGYAGNFDNLIPEKDVMDTWMTSSVSPQIATNWIGEEGYNNDISFKKVFPMQLRPQAHDIIRTWAFYTIVKAYYHHQTIPWENIAISGHIQDPHGRKMSKSIGNVIDPRVVLGKYGADAFRFFAAGSKLGDDLPYQEKDLLTGQKFVTKLWNASKFGLMHLEDYKPVSSVSDVTSGIKVTEVYDKWLLSKLQKVIRNSTETFEKYEYSRTKSEVENFFWHTFCDNYLEIVKDRLYNPTIRGVSPRESGQEGVYTGILTILKLMAPIMPHITEEIYHLYFAEKEGKNSIHTADWPKFEEELVDGQAELIGDIGIDIINIVRKFKSEQKMSMKDELNELVLISGENDLISSDENFAEMIKGVEADLKAVLKVKEIKFTGETSLETEKFNVKVGIIR